MNRIDATLRSVNVRVMCALLIVLLGWFAAPLVPVISSGGCQMMCCRSHSHFDDDEGEVCCVVIRRGFNKKNKSGSYNASIQSKCPINCTAPTTSVDVHKRFTNKPPHLAFYPVSKANNFEFKPGSVHRTPQLSSLPSRAPPIA